MNGFLISNWNNIDPIQFYQERLDADTLAYDKQYGVWIANAYELCKSLLSHPALLIPGQQLPPDRQPDPAISSMISQLARLNDGERHQLAREAAIIIYQSIRAVNTGDLLQLLIPNSQEEIQFDWVGSVSKKLPAMVTLKGLGFSEDSMNWMIENLPVLARITAPDKTPDDINLLNQVIHQFIDLTTQQVKVLVSRSPLVQKNSPHTKTLSEELLVTNMLGLLIQSYDAGRALLANLMCHIDKFMITGQDEMDRINCKKFIDEVMRIDPPVHFTRRVAARDIQIEDKLIKRGQQIILLIAAANLDKKVFDKPAEFNHLRVNNAQALSFGSGAHACVAKQLVLSMGAETTMYLKMNYDCSGPVSETAFERAMNARHYKELIITIKRK